MNFSDVLITLFEVALVAFTIWAVFHEDYFIVLEDKIMAHFRRRKFKVIEGSRISKSYYPVNDR